MDKLRAQIHTLTLQLEDERSRHVTAVSISARLRMRRQKDYRARDFKFAVANEIAQECYCNLYLLSVLQNYTLSSFLYNVAV